MKHQQPMKRNEIKPMSWQPNERTPFVRFIARLPYLVPLVLLLLVLSGCSKALSPVQITPLPANLAAACKKIPMPPAILIDPDRATWESDLIAKYEDCALRHRLTVRAWLQQSQTK